MIFSDYKCDECGHVFEGAKRYVMDDFPELKCPKCTSNNTHRIFSIGATDTAVGSVGNSKTGFKNEFTYHPSKFGKFKGKKVK